MKTLNVTKLSLLAGLALTSTAALAQRNGPDWNTASFDVQRSNWMRADLYVTSASMAKPGFGLHWKQKIDGVKGGLSAPTTVGTFIGWLGFKDLVLFQGGDGNLYTIDSDLGVPYFDKKYGVAPSKACALTSIGAAGRPSLLAPPNPAGRPMAAPYHSVTGKPGEGIPGGTNPGRGFGTPGFQQPRQQPAPSGGLNQGGRSATPLYVITPDGVLHVNAHGTGNEYEKPTPFIPAGSQISDITEVGKVVYVATLPGCGSSPNTVYAMDRNDVANPTVKQWKAGENILGTPAFSSLGNLYVTTTKSLVALEPKTLAAKTLATGSYASSPMIFTTADKKEYVTAGTTDGKLVVMDAGTGAVVASADTKFNPTGLAGWQDKDGTQYIVVSDKTKQKGAVTALKFSGSALEQAWTTAELDAPGTPIILNGVIFALATGENRSGKDLMTRAKGKGAVLYAFDGKTGKPLWDSGTAVTAPVTTSGLATGSGDIYFATADNTVYAFGFPQERQ